MSLASYLVTLEPAMLPMAIWITSFRLVFISLRSLLPTVISLSKKRKRGSFIEVAVRFNLSNWAGRTFKNDSDLSWTVRNHCTYWDYWAYPLDLGLVPISISSISSSLTSCIFQSKFKVRSVFCSLRIFSALTGKPLQAGDSTLGSFSIHSTYWD